MPRSTRLRRSTLAVALAGAAWLSGPSAAAAQVPDAPVAISQQPADPPAHINYVDGTVVLERDGQPDSSPVNMPLLAGDRIRTENGRVEIVFADGSTLHLDLQSSVDFQSDELIRLRAGRVRLTIPGPARSVSYRIDAPAGSAEIAQPGDYRVSLLAGPAAEVELAVLRGAADLVNDGGRTTLRAGERALVRANAAPSYAFVFNSAAWDAFDRWSETRRDQRAGASAQYLPEEVRPYSTSFDQYGAWQYESSYGYVWYPTVASTWRPYYYGRWAPLPAYGWTWIGSDPWAWPTHHYGRWGFSAGLWFWIPGRVWSPAWVSWAYAPGYVSWCPLGYNNHAVFGLNVSFGHGYSPWHGWTVVPHQHFGHGYVQARGVPAAVPRTGFAYGTGAPSIRGVAVPRATAPIRSAGAAVPRASSPITTYRSANGTPVYTNLPRGESRVGSAPSDVGTAPRAPASESRRAVTPDPGAGRAQAVPRTGQPAPSASPRVSPSADAAPPAGMTPPRASGRAGTIERTPSPTAVPRDDRPYGSAYRRPGGGPAEVAPAPPPTSPPDRQIHQPAPRAPEAAPGVRAVPRSYEAPPPPPAYRSAPGGEPRAAEPARPSAPPPSAAPRAEGRPNAAPPPQRSGGGQSSSGRAVPRGRGGV